MSKLRAAITGVAHYVPETLLTNHDLEKFLDTSDEWILSRSGIKQRHILKDPTKATAFLAVEAGKKLLQKTNTKPEDIELLILTTATPDHQFPATANIVAYELGLKNAWSFDLMAACSGFLYTLFTASRFIESGTHKKVMVIGSEKMSSIIDYTDRKTAILFGDGAGAVLLEPDSTGNGIIDAKLYSDGYGKQFLNQPAGGSLVPASEETVKHKQHFVHMDGPAVFKHAVICMADVSEEIMKRNNLSASDVQWFTPHQANKRIIISSAERMGLPMDKVMLNIDRYGNTTTASIPICFSEWESKLKKGDNVVLSSFGAGFTWGGMYLKWAY
ncbi:MAG: beta-ketoacyl-ACP synthase III [Flavobacteriales bacterium]